MVAYFVRRRGGVCAVVELRADNREEVVSFPPFSGQTWMSGKRRPGCQDRERRAGPRPRPFSF